MAKKLNSIGADIENIEKTNCNLVDDDNDNINIDGVQESSSHLGDEPGRGEAHVTHRTDGRDWTAKKHDPDGTSPEHIDLGDDHDLDTNSDDGEEVGDQYFRMSVTNVTANTAMLRSSTARAKLMPTSTEE